MIAENEATIQTEADETLKEASDAVIIKEIWRRTKSHQDLHDATDADLRRCQLQSRFSEMDVQLLRDQIELLKISEGVNH